MGHQNNKKCVVPIKSINALIPCMKENKVYTNNLMETNDCLVLALKDDDEIDSILYQLYFSMQDLKWALKVLTYLHVILNCSK